VSLSRPLNIMTGLLQRALNVGPEQLYSKYFGFAIKTNSLLWPSIFVCLGPRLSSMRGLILISSSFNSWF